jgi:hypothetical protein
MSNAKLRLAYAERDRLAETATVAAPGPGVPRSAGTAPTPEAGLRLIRAFLQIADASCRNWLVEYAERMSRP